MEVSSEEKLGYGSILKEKNYMIYMISNLISRFGDSIDTIAYGWMVYQITGSTALLATLFGVNAIPTILFQPIAGVFVDYKKKKNVLFICNLGRGAVVTLTAALFFYGSLLPIHLFIFTFINSTFEAFQSPASIASVQLILPKEKYTHGIALNTTVVKIVELVGLSVAGVLVAVVGISGTIFIDAVTFFMCGFMILLVKYKDEIIKRNKISFKGYFNDLKDGFKYLRNNKLVLNVCIFGAIICILFIPINTLNAAYVKDVLKQGPEIVGVIGAAITVGMSLGSIVFPKLKSRVKGVYLFVAAGSVLGMTYLAFSGLAAFKAPTLMYGTLVLSCGVFGIAGAIFELIINVSFVNNVEREYMARVGGVFNSLAMSATPVGSLIVAGLCLLLNIQSLFVIFGILIIVMFILQFINKTLREL